ncbi:NUDIX hydrolase [Brachybacterium sp. YJGR34]|uniref:NUDIX domain-containing protein n=1 Tax=Brachybacterium sp. YJGR34 TaxID=2059911 RepID=UPI0013008998|nr:NUDIX hydrolase [Brachybacterium sp. YJGR34]
MITSALFHDGHDQVLCVDPVYKETWHLPGGSVEAGESPSDACVRECHEELGIAIHLGRLLAVGHLRPAAEDPHGALAFVYEASLGASTTADLRIPPDELRQVAWLDGSQRRAQLSPLAQQLVTSSMEAVGSGTVIEFDRSGT